MSIDKDARLDLSIKQQIIWGGSLALFLVVGLGGWTATASLESAVIAPATVVVEASKKSVQHDAGGIVAAINVKNGDLVKRGDVLFRFDGTQIAAEIAALEKRTFDYSVRRLRLIAERDGKSEFALLSPLKNQISRNKELVEIVWVQANLLVTRRKVQDGKRKQLEERIAQLQQEVIGLRQVEKALEEELSLFAEELGGLAELRAKRLVNLARYIQLKRSLATKRGTLGSTRADIARTEGRISETRLQIIDVSETARSEVLKELQSLEGELAQLSERLRAARDRQSKLAVRASDAGHIHELLVHTVGGVVKAGDTLAQLVPSQSKLVIDAHVKTTDRDQIYPGMAARVQFTAFSQRSTPQLTGRIERIASDQSTGRDGRLAPHYAVRVALDTGEIQRLGSLDVVAGMPAEIMMTSKSRTVLSYLMKPLTDQINRAFRNE